jgi:hypothetical protein
MLTPAPSPFSRYSLYTPAKHEHSVCKQNRNAVNIMGMKLLRKKVGCKRGKVHTQCRKLYNEEYCNLQIA